jgi:hypothetical protein
MTTQYKSGRTASGSLLTYLLALLLGAAALAVFLRKANDGLPGRLATLISGRPSTEQISVPFVVERVQRLNRLETVVYSLDAVVEGETPSPILSSVLPDSLATDKLLLIVHGNAVAGIDLAKLKPEEVRIDPSDPHSIHMNLPASELFSVTLDNEHTKVYSRTTGLLVPTDPNLESNTRAKAQKQLQAAALSDGILDAARRNARATVTTLLQSLGFQRVDVT